MGLRRQDRAVSQHSPGVSQQMRQLLNGRFPHFRHFLLEPAPDLISNRFAELGIGGKRLKQRSLLLGRQKPCGGTHYLPEHFIQELIVLGERLADHITRSVDNNPLERNVQLHHAGSGNGAHREGAS